MTAGVDHCTPGYHLCPGAGCVLTATQCTDDTTGNTLYTKLNTAIILHTLAVSYNVIAKRMAIDDGGLDSCTQTVLCNVCPVQSLLWQSLALVSVRPCSFAVPATMCVSIRSGSVTHSETVLMARTRPTAWDAEAVSACIFTGQVMVVLHSKCLADVAFAEFYWVV